MTLAMASTIACPECSAPMVLRRTLRFRLASGAPRLFWGCSAWPTCEATHGAHADGTPFGVPGDQATKEARIRAHDEFDRLWKGPTAVMSRPAAYRELQRVMDMTKDEAHIGRFSVEECEDLIAILEDLYP